MVFLAPKFTGPDLNLLCFKKNLKGVSFSLKQYIAIHIKMY